MAFKGQKVTVTANTVTALTSSDTDQLVGQSISIMPASADVWLGGPDVDTTGADEGAKLPAGTPFSTDLDPREVLYVKATADTTLYVLHQGV